MARSTGKSMTAAGSAAPEKAPSKGAAKAPSKAAAKPRTQSTAKRATKKAAANGGPAPAAPSGTLAVGAGEEAWTKKELAEVVAELTAHRDRLATEIQEQEEELAGLMRDAGDGAGQDQADLGATSFERDHELTVVNNSRDMIAQIDRALGRITDGSYGTCESCGNPIGKMRLMAFPRATLCMSCKQREEKRASH